ncbi:hypothetical protein DMI69_12315 [Escherichia coli]|nr:hypothetical protein [Escherichia coli]
MMLNFLAKMPDAPQLPIWREWSKRRLMPVPPPSTFRHRGYTMPFEFAGIISGLYERVPNIDKAIISVHTIDDLGPAVGNSLAAVRQHGRKAQ